jgi:hypothetical protein
MTLSKALGLSLFVLAVAAVGAVLVVVGPQWYGADQPAPQKDPPVAVERRIKATLFYVSESGERLAPLEREVPYGEGVVEQARLIVEAEIAAPPAPLVSAVPSGTKVRALYLGARGEAYVDLSREVVTGHTGGSVDEILTVYALVNGLTVNLPAIASVQILVDGREVDTLAGHIDLRRPLMKSRQWVQ